MDDKRLVRRRIHNVIIETVKLLCSSTLQYQSEMKIEGVIGITLDEEEMCIIHISECLSSSAIGCERTACEQEGGATLNDRSTSASSVQAEPQEKDLPVKRKVIEIINADGADVQRVVTNENNDSKIHAHDSSTDGHARTVSHVSGFHGVLGDKSSVTYEQDLKEQCSNEQHSNEPHSSEQYSLDLHSCSHEQSSEHLSNNPHSTDLQLSQQHLNEQHSSEKHLRNLHSSELIFDNPLSSKHHLSEQHSSEEHFSEEHSNELHLGELHLSEQHSSERVSLAPDCNVKLEPVDNDLDIYCTDDYNYDDIDQKPFDIADCFEYESAGVSNGSIGRKRSRDTMEGLLLGDVSGSSDYSLTYKQSCHTSAADRRCTRLKQTSSNTLTAAWGQSEDLYLHPFPANNFPHSNIVPYSNSRLGYDASYAPSDQNHHGARSGSHETEEERIIRQREQNRLRVRRCRLRAKLAAQGIVLPRSSANITGNYL